MGLITPSYFRPMLTSWLGINMIVFGILLCLLARFCFVLILRWAESAPARSRFAPLLMTLPMIFLIFPALWIVLVGPSLIVVARITQG